MQLALLMHYASAEIILNVGPLTYERNEEDSLISVPRLDIHYSAVP